MHQPEWVRPRPARRESQDPMIDQYERISCGASLAMCAYDARAVGR